MKRKEKIITIIMLVICSICFLANFRITDKDREAIQNCVDTGLSQRTCEKNYFGN